MSLRTFIFVAAAFAFARSAPAADAHAWFGLGFTCHSAGNATPCDALVVIGIAPKGPAYRAGVMPHDVITKINGKAVRFGSHAAALDFFRACRVGDKLRLNIVRDGKPHEIVIPGETLPPEFAARWPSNDELARRRDAKPHP